MTSFLPILQMDQSSMSMTKQLSNSSMLILNPNNKLTIPITIGINLLTAIIFTKNQVHPSIQNILLQALMSWLNNVYQPIEKEFE